MKFWVNSLVVHEMESQQSIFRYKVPSEYLYGPSRDGETNGGSMDILEVKLVADIRV